MATLVMLAVLPRASKDIEENSAREAEGYHIKTELKGVEEYY
jgi:hypothetical protein